MNDHRKHEWLRWMIPAAVLIALFGNMGDLGVAFALPVTLALIVGAVVALRGPVGKALARHLEGTPPVQGDDPALYEELDGLRARVMELEERVDFAERLLARQREHDELGAG
jgi:hypothetical protein